MISAAVMNTAVMSTAVISTGCAHQPSSTASVQLTSDRDPPPYTPTPATNARTGETIGLTTAGGIEQALQVAERMLVAIQQRDEATLQQLLAERVARSQPRISEPNNARAQVVQMLLESNRRRHISPNTPLETLVDLEHADAQLLREIYQGERRIPNGLQPSDVFLSFPLHDEGRRALRPLLNWSHRGTMIVRTGVQPSVIGM